MTRVDCTREETTAKRVTKQIGTFNQKKRRGVEEGCNRDPKISKGTGNEVGELNLWDRRNKEQEQEVPTGTQRRFKGKREEGKAGSPRER